MAFYTVNAVHLGAGQRVERARVQMAHPGLNQWIGAEQELEASALANLIAGGDELHAIFQVDGQRVAGPKFYRNTDAAGVEGVAMEQDAQGRTVVDLPQF